MTKTIYKAALYTTFASIVLFLPASSVPNKTQDNPLQDIKPVALLEPLQQPQLAAKAPLAVTVQKVATGAYSGSHEDWMRAAGISPADFRNVDYIVTRESGWNPNALNPIGACSLVQALPCSKIPGDWHNPVDALRWQHGYVNARFGGYGGAVAYWVAHGNY